MEAMNTLTAKVGSMDTVIVEKLLTAVDASVDEKVNARIGEAELVFTQKISTLQEEIAQLREQMQANAPKNDAHYNVNHEDESRAMTRHGRSKTKSHHKWMRQYNVWLERKPKNPRSS
ncbi:unnamed protein product [Brassica rapa subsp. trilocularis]